MRSGGLRLVRRPSSRTAAEQSREDGGAGARGKGWFDSPPGATPRVNPASCQLLHLRPTPRLAPAVFEHCQPPRPWAGDPSRLLRAQLSKTAGRFLRTVLIRRPALAVWRESRDTVPGRHGELSPVPPGIVSRNHHLARSRRPRLIVCEGFGLACARFPPGSPSSPAFAPGRRHPPPPCPRARWERRPERALRILFPPRHSSATYPAPPAGAQPSSLQPQLPYPLRLPPASPAREEARLATPHPTRLLFYIFSSPKDRQRAALLRNTPCGARGVPRQPSKTQAAAPARPTATSGNLCPWTELRPQCRHHRRPVRDPGLDRAGHHSPAPWKADSALNGWNAERGAPVALALFVAGSRPGNVETSPPAGDYV